MLGNVLVTALCEGVVAVFAADLVALLGATQTLTHCKGTVVVLLFSQLASGVSWTCDDFFIGLGIGVGICVRIIVDVGFGFRLLGLFFAIWTRVDGVAGP